MQAVQLNHIVVLIPVEHPVKKAIDKNTSTNLILDPSRAADDIASHPEEKVERWEVLKSTTVARCAARVYCAAALALLLRV